MKSIFQFQPKNRHSPVVSRNVYQSKRPIEILSSFLKSAINCLLVNVVRRKKSDVTENSVERNIQTVCQRFFQPYRVSFAFFADAHNA